MDVRAFVIACSVVVSATIGLVWQRPRDGSPADRVPPSTDVPCKIAVGRGVASFDIRLPSDSTCDLIVGSLGDAGELFEVQLVAEPIERVEQPSPRHEVFALQAISRRNAACGCRLRASCPVVDSSPQGAGDACGAGSRAIADTRTFFLHVRDTDLADPAGYVAVVSRLAGEGRQARVYVDSQVRATAMPVGRIAEILRLLDDEVFPGSVQLLGTHRDIDGDGKLAVLVTPWLGRLRGGQATAGGFVRSSDFQDRLPAPFSNRADLLYLNALLPEGDVLRALLTHEYAHAVCISRRLPDEANPAGCADEHDWLNEAIAHVAENLQGAGWSNLDTRIGRFLENTSQAPLAVRDYYRAGLWRDAGCRGATYLFLQWCVEQHGPGLLRRLVENNAAGIENLETCTGTSFGDLFRQWTISLHQNEIRSLSLHGKLGACDLRGVRRIVWRPGELATNSVALRGTAAAFVRIETAASESAWHIVAKSPPQARLQLTLVPAAKPSADEAAPFRGDRAETRRLAARRD